MEQGKQLRITRRQLTLGLLGTIGSFVFAGTVFVFVSVDWYALHQHSRAQKKMDIAILRLAG